MTRVALVTGGSSGIGLCTAQALRDKGAIVYTLSRRAAQDDHHLQADVTDEAALQSAIAGIVSREGRLDILVNCAGFGISGAVEFTEPAAAKRLFDVDFFGTVNAVYAALPVLRAQKSGRIVNISSVAAPVPIPFQTYYSAAKAAVSAFSMALANEVRPYGVTVCAVMPGDIKTEFTAAREKIHLGDDVYGGRIARSVAKMEHDEQTGMSAEAAGRFIAHVALRRGCKPLCAIGFTYKFFVLLSRILPVSFLNRLIYGLYAA